VGTVVGPGLTGLVVQFAPTYNDMLFCCVRLGWIMQRLIALGTWCG
jgi:hypothetical protein